MHSGRVAVVGSGISGLSVAWLLAQRYAVTLFESEERLGGHTHTVDVTLDGVTAPVDTGFLVFNDQNYPNLVALFDRLGVESTASDMSFSARIEEDGVEWAGSSLPAVFAQKRNLMRPEFWAMLKDVLRFNATAVALVSSGNARGSLGDWLKREGFGRAFRNWYLLPMAAAIWSCPTAQVLAYPVQTFLRFFHNHGLLQLNGRPKWRTVVGGGREYVQRMAAELGDVRLGTSVRKVRRAADHVTVVSSSDQAERFAYAVLACHGDQALQLLDDCDEHEARVLGAVRYGPNRLVLHTDRSFMPRSREAWSAWNYLSNHAHPGSDPVSLSYWLNCLQPLPFRQPLIETLNPSREPHPDRVLGRFEYRHPLFDAAAIAAQAELPRLQGRRRTWWCGAWTGFGFHEDGLRSALAVANALGVRASWQREVAQA